MEMASWQRPGAINQPECPMKNNVSPFPKKSTFRDASQPAKPDAADAWTEDSSDWNTPPSGKQSPEAPNPIALKARHLNVMFGQHPAISNIDLTLYQGDTLGLLGLNGAGKTTLLKVLAGALTPNYGHVLIGENDLYEQTVEARMDIGYAPDKPALFPEFKVVEFLRHIARMRHIEKTQIKIAVDRVIECCALGEMQNRIIGNLSSGYQQRINLAQALIHNPRILILDEPANGLDPVQLMEMRQLIEQLAPEQATIFSSHLLSEVNSICNRVILVHNGRTTLDTSLDQLANKNNTTFELTLQGDDASETVLQALPGVIASNQIEANRWVITGNDINASHIRTMLMARGYQTSQITQADNHLECIFQHLSPTSNPTSNKAQSQAQNQTQNQASSDSSDSTIKGAQKK